jgi:hypothetical protein
MFVNVSGLGQIASPRRRTRVIPIPVRRRGMGQATAPGGCLLEDAPLGCSPSGKPWQASGGGPANNWVYYDSITGKPLDLTNACYVNDDLLVNCGDTGDFGGGSPQPAGPISILAQTPAYVAAVAAANAAYVPPAAAPPTAVNPLASNPSFWDVLIGSTPATSGSQGVSATMVNTSRPGQSLQVGDSWALTVTGAPNSPVSNSATQNGTALGTTPYGSTNGAGVFTLNGTATASTVGNWSETWSVGGVNAPALNFTVSAASSGSPSGPGAASGSPLGGNSVNPQPAVSPAASAPSGCFAPLGALGIPDPCLGGFPVGMGTLAAGVLAFFIVGSMFGGKR